MKPSVPVKILPFILFLLFFPASLLLSQQESSILEFIHADSLVGSEKESFELREFAGNVHMRQGKVDIFCDHAIQHITQEFVELIGNVLITQDTLVLKTDRGYYYNTRKYASTSTGIFLNDGTVTLTARNGRYSTDTRIAHFSRDVEVLEPSAIIHAQQLVYNRDSSKATATDSVLIQFLENNAIIRGDTVFHYIDAKRSIFPASPVMWQVDTTWIKADSLSEAPDSTTLDTLSIAAQYMEALRDSSNQFFARGNVEMVRGAFAATAQMVDYLRSDSVVILQDDPLLWYEENQLKGDSVVVTLRNNSIDLLQIFGAAVSVSRSKPSESDTLSPKDRFDQTTGTNIEFQFHDDKLQKITVEGKARSLYYLYDGKALNGLRKESGDKIIIDFNDGEASYIKTLRGVEGTYFPERFVTGKETSFNMDGFFWQETSPAQPVMPLPISPDE